MYKFLEDVWHNNQFQQVTEKYLLMPSKLLIDTRGRSYGVQMCECRPLVGLETTEVNNSHFWISLVFDNFTSSGFTWH